LRGVNTLTLTSARRRLDQLIGRQPHFILKQMLGDSIFSGGVLIFHQVAFAEMVALQFHFLSASVLIWSAVF
jgi:hypothetical protein